MTFFFFFSKRFGWVGAYRVDSAPFQLQLGWYNSCQEQAILLMSGQCTGSCQGRYAFLLAVRPCWSLLRASCALWARACPWYPRLCRSCLLGMSTRCSAVGAPLALACVGSARPLCGKKEYMFAGYCTDVHMHVRLPMCIYAVVCVHMRICPSIHVYEYVYIWLYEYMCICMPQMFASIVDISVGHTDHRRADRI